MRYCKLTGKRPMIGYNVSHAHNRTKKRQLPNLQTKRVWDNEKKRWIKLRVSTRALRTLDKKGLNKFLQETGIKL